MPQNSRYPQETTRILIARNWLCSCESLARSAEKRRAKSLPRIPQAHETPATYRSPDPKMALSVRITFQARPQLYQCRNILAQAAHFLKI